MGIFNSLSGSVRIELTGADIANSLCAINAQKIAIANMQMIGDLTVRFTVMRRQIKRLNTIAQIKGDRLDIISYEGVFWKLRDIKQRPVFLSGIALLLCLAIFLPSWVLFIEVEGNDKIPANLILEAARYAGIGFGNSRRDVRSEKVKNRLLGALPELQWAGVNTYGCTAVISVKERDTEKKSNQSYTVSHMVAASDGVITSCVVTSGSGLCSEGQAVQKGQVLISGYTDCGGVITAGRGQGEIFAQTRHRFLAVSPAEVYIRETILEKQIRYSLQFGKKRINFYKGSGIYDGSCVKMITQYHLTLPGDYALPVTLVKEERISYRSNNKQLDESTAVADLSRFSESYIRQNGVALTVVEKQETVEKNNGLFILDGVYGCTEMIGREQGVQIGEFHGKTD